MPPSALTCQTYFSSLQQLVRPPFPPSSILKHAVALSLASLSSLGLCSHVLQYSHPTYPPVHDCNETLAGLLHTPLTRLAGNHCSYSERQSRSHTTSGQICPPPLRPFRLCIVHCACALIQSLSLGGRFPVPSTWSRKSFASTPESTPSTVRYRHTSRDPEPQPQSKAHPHR